MTDSTVTAAAALVDIPEDAIAEHGITILSYLSPEDGDTYYAIAVHGDPPLSSIVGLCTLAQRAIINDYYSQEENDE